MADWQTIGALATAGGTLVLAVATFGAIRSANRSARVAEQAMLMGMRLASRTHNDSAGRNTSVDQPTNERTMGRSVSIS